MGESKAAQAVRAAMGSSVVSLINTVENYSWYYKDSNIKPMGWSYNRIANIESAIKGKSFNVGGVKEVFAKVPFLTFLPKSKTDKDNVSGQQIVDALKATINYQLAQLTVGFLSKIAKTGDIEQLAKWKSAIDERGIANFKASGAWLNPTDGQLDTFIDKGDKTVWDVYDRASSIANGVVSSKWNHLIQTANNIQNISDLYSPFPQTGSSMDLRTILQDGLSNLTRILGDGKIAQNEVPSGILDYYALLRSDVNWLKGRQSTTEPNDVKVANGLENFSSVDAVRDAVENRLVSFIKSQTDWMKAGLGRYKQVKSQEDKEKVFLIVTSVVSAVAAVGSIGFSISNWRAVASQWGKSGVNSLSLRQP